MVTARAHTEHHDEDEHGHAEVDEGEHHDEVTIDEKTATELGVLTAKAGPGVVRDEHEVQGLLTTIEGKHARVRARFPGVVQTLRAGIGDVVKAGQALAVIESNASLTTYTVDAPFAGTILHVATGPGDLAGDEPLFELADLTYLWVDLHLFGGDAQHIGAGLPIELTRLSDGLTPRSNSTGSCRARRRRVRAPWRARRFATPTDCGGLARRSVHASRSANARLRLIVPVSAIQSMTVTPSSSRARR